MEYFTEHLDRKTGTLVTLSQGDWITITELGEHYNAGPRQVRTILRKLEVLVVEGSASHQRHRLASWFVTKGWGRRIERKNAAPFDVVSPEGQDWIADRWLEAVASVERSKSSEVVRATEALARYTGERRDTPMATQAAVCWLAVHYPTLSQSDIALVLDVTQQLVSKFLNIRTKQLEEAQKLFDSLQDDEDSC